MRSWSSEAVTMATVLAIPLSIAAMLPYEALGFRAAERKGAARASAGFVALSEAAERRARLVAKTSWQRNREGDGELHANLSFGELPEDRDTHVLFEVERSRPTDEPVACGLSPYLPSRRAAPAGKIEPDGKPDETPAFSREELLKMD